MPKQFCLALHGASRNVSVSCRHPGYGWVFGPDGGLAWVFGPDGALPRQPLAASGAIKVTRIFTKSAHSHAISIDVKSQFHSLTRRGRLSRSMIVRFRQPLSSAPHNVFVQFRPSRLEGSRLNTKKPRHVCVGGAALSRSSFRRKPLRYRRKVNLCVVALAVGSSDPSMRFRFHGVQRRDPPIGSKSRDAWKLLLQCP